MKLRTHLVSVAKLHVLAQCAALVLLAGHACAEADPERHALNSPHLEHTSVISGIGGAFYSAWNPGHEHEANHTITAGGVRGFIEFNVIEHILEIELSAAGLWDGQGNQYVTADLLLKKSFEFDRFNPYIGVGPTLSVDLLEHETESAIGAAFAAGCYYWLSDHVGIDIDLAYGLLSRPGGTGQELAIAIGPVVRF